MKGSALQLCLFGVCGVLFVSSQPTAIDLDFCQDSALLRQVARSVELLTQQTKALSVSFQLLQQQFQKDNKLVAERFTQYKTETNVFQGNLSRKLDQLDKTTKEIAEKAIPELELTCKWQISKLREEFLQTAQNQSAMLEHIKQTAELTNTQSQNNYESLVREIKTALNETNYNAIVSFLNKQESTLDNIYELGFRSEFENKQNTEAIRRALVTEIGTVGEQLVSVVAATIDGLMARITDANSTDSVNITGNSTESENLAGSGYNSIAYNVVRLVEIFHHAQTEDITGIVQKLSRDINDNMAHIAELNRPKLTALCSASGLGDKLTELQRLMTTGEVCPKQFLGDIIKYAVRLQVGTLRLVNGTAPTNGRVELYYGGAWGTVCDDSWGTNDARVVCRQMGYCGGAAINGIPYGAAASNVPIHLDDVACGGSEGHLLKCSSTTVGSHNCGHTEDAGVRCDVC